MKGPCVFLASAASDYLNGAIIPGDEDAFDHFQCKMVKYGKKLFVIHGERAWKAAKEYVVPAIEKAGLIMLGDLLYGHDVTHENVKKICEDPRAY